MTPTTPTLRVRKNLIDLTSQEIADLRNAFSLLYEDESAPYQNIAGILSTLGHTDRNDLLFLPWARAYFNEFELLLRSKVENVTLPYWDYTSETSQSEGIPSIVADPLTEEGKPNPLYRGKWSLPLYTFRESGTPEDLAQAAALEEAALAQSDFVSFSTSIWLVDIASHRWIGGSAGGVETTSFDPLFWFSHCNLDRFWYQWQHRYDDFTAPDSVRQARLQPFTDSEGSILTGDDVLRAAALGYTYA